MKKPFILATNINDLPLKPSGERYAAKEREISLGVLPEDVNKFSPTIYAYRQGMIYNPNDNFRPNVNGGHTLPDYLQDEYFKYIDEARTNFKALQEHLKNVIGGGNSAELVEELRTDLSNAKRRIREQAEKIAELSANGATNNINNNSQTERLEALIELQAAALKQINDMKPKEIIIKIGDKVNKMKEEIFHSEFETILAYLAEGDNVYMSGPAGTGKSHIAAQVAKALGLKFYPTQALSQEYKITGYKDANGLYHDTAFRRSFEDGGVYMIDEIDASHPDVLVAINTALANGYFDFEDGRIDAHPDFRCIAAGNTNGRGATDEYTGRQAIDISTLDRFWLVEILYHEPIELAISGNNHELVEFAHKVREAAAENGISILFSYRSIERIAKFENKLPLLKVLEQGLLKGMQKDDVNILLGSMNINSNNKYYKELRKAA